MTMSMRALANRKAINKEVQYNNRLTIFTNPPVQTGDLNVSRDLTVARDLTVSGNTTLNTLSVSTLSVSTLSVSGLTDISNLIVVNDIICNGSIYASKYLQGQVIYTCMLNYTDLSQNTIDISSNIGENNNTRTIFNYDYFARNDSSQILIEYQSDYFVNSVNNSEIQAYLYVKNNINEPDTRRAETHQHWSNSVMQSNTMFPIVGRFTNTSNGIRHIRVDVFNATDNILTVYGNKSTWLKITEIGM